MEGPLEGEGRAYRERAYAAARRATTARRDVMVVRSRWSISDGDVDVDVEAAIVTSAVCKRVKRQDRACFAMVLELWCVWRCRVVEAGRELQEVNWRLGKCGSDSARLARTDP